MLVLSQETKMICGIALITVPSVQYGGVTLLKMLRSRERGYLGNPLRQNLFRAGHAHAGVILILSFVCQILVDAISLPQSLAWVVRLGVPSAAILMPLGFFLSVRSPRSERPNGMIPLVYVGATVMAISVLILGIELVRAAV